MQSENATNTKRANRVTKIGYTITLASAALLLFVYKSTITNEVKYTITTKYPRPTGGVLIPYNEEFSIIIPKIGANSPVIENVDPWEDSEYQQALRNGVAHAAGTATPDQHGNTFLFAHSSTNFYEANKYNSVFYLLRKLEPRDIFYIEYKGDMYTYRVTDAQIIEPENVQYLENVKTDMQAKNTATLMTCWPPGTTSKRLLVFGEQTQD